MNQEHNQSQDDIDKQSSNSGLQKTYDYSMHTQPNDRAAELSEIFQANNIGNEEDLDIQYEFDDASEIASHVIDEEEKLTEQQQQQLRQ